MILLTLRDLVHRRVRFVVVSLLGAVVFALLFVMTGLVEQFHREPFDAVSAFGASGWVLPDGVSGPFTAAPTLPMTVLDDVAADSKGPVVTSRSTLVHDDVSEEVVLIGVDMDGLGAPPVVDGRLPRGPGEAVVDSSADIELNSAVEVAGVPFTVVGLAEDRTILAGIPMVFVPTIDAQDLVFRSRDVISAVLVDGASTPAPGTAVIGAEQIAQDTLAPLEGAIASVDLVRALLWVVAAVIIGAVVYLSALERQRDFAVLKAIGAPNRSLLMSLALQAVLVALVAVAVAAVIQLFLAPAFPLRVRVPSRAFWQLPVFAVAMALVAGAAGMRKVARSDPALAFAGAGG